MPRDDYEERKEARIERYEERAEKKRAEANARFNSQNIETLRGLQGEPVKIGHHSERRHRRLIEKADNDMRKGFEATAAAAHYDEKATAAKCNGSISSDDPEALTLLREKLAELEADQEAEKATNRTLRKLKVCVDDPDWRERLLAADIPDEHKKDLIRLMQVAPYEGRPHLKFPGYSLSNRNARIKSTRERIASLEREFARAAEAAESGETTREEQRDGFTVVENIELNRLQLVFPGKPSEAVRTILKRNGFRWARSERAWQRLLNDNSRSVVRYIAPLIEAAD